MTPELSGVEYRPLPEALAPEVTFLATVYLYDTTLRDGAQMEGISYSVEDKLHIARKLDDLGIHYIEAGWPAANPKDIEFVE